MIISFASGQFGNQIFQYLFCKKIQTERNKNELLILIGYDDINNIFEKKCFEKTFFIKRNNRIRRIFWNRIIRNILMFSLSITRIISTCIILKEFVLENFQRETTNYMFKKGLFNKILFFPTFYAQSEVFFKKEHAESLIIKSEYTEKAKQLILTDQNKLKIFVHLRLGDYSNFSIYGQSAILPPKYFETCCETMGLKYSENSVFYIFSNESNLDKYDFIKRLKNYKIMRNEFAVDFALMTLCNGAIVSASSFSWWGSYFMKEKIEVLAPKHWLGFASGIDYQMDATRADMTLVEINS